MSQNSRIFFLLGRGTCRGSPGWRAHPVRPWGPVQCYPLVRPGARSARGSQFFALKNFKVQTGSILTFGVDPPSLADRPASLPGSIGVDPRTWHRPRRHKTQCNGPNRPSDHQGSTGGRSGSIIAVFQDLLRYLHCGLAPISRETNPPPTGTPSHPLFFPD